MVSQISSTQVMSDFLLDRIGWCSSCWKLRGILTQKSNRVILSMFIMYNMPPVGNLFSCDIYSHEEWKKINNCVLWQICPLMLKDCSICLFYYKQILSTCLFLLLKGGENGGNPSVLSAPIVNNGVSICKQKCIYFVFWWTETRTLMDHCITTEKPPATPHVV